MNKREVAQLLEDFLTGKSDRWAWDDFTQGPSLVDADLEQIRVRCAGLSREFPPDNSREYCNNDGRKVIRDYIDELRSTVSSKGLDG